MDVTLLRWHRFYNAVYGRWPFFRSGFSILRCC